MAEEIKKHEEKPKGLTIEQMDAETKRIAYEAAQIDLEIKRQELSEIGLRRRERELATKDLEQRVSDRELKDKQIQNDRASQGNTFRQQDNEDRGRWKVCTHKKGGTASSRDVRVLTTGGNGEQYAVIKHQMINGDIWVRCLRCGKTWKPPLEKDFYMRDGIVVALKDGKFNALAFEKAGEDYIRALQFETRNAMSASIQCRFTRIDPETRKIVDGAEQYRENVGASNLR